MTIFEERLPPSSEIVVSFVEDVRGLADTEAIAVRGGKHAARLVASMARARFRWSTSADSYSYYSDDEKRWVICVSPAPLFYTIGEGGTLEPKRFISRMSMSSAAAILGASIHEIAHALYSPGKNNWEDAPFGFSELFPLIEDIRVNTLLVADRAPAGEQFLAAAYNWRNPVRFVDEGVRAAPSMFRNSLGSAVRAARNAAYASYAAFLNGFTCTHRDDEYINSIINAVLTFMSAVKNREQYTGDHYTCTETFAVLVQTLHAAAIGANPKELIPYPVKDAPWIQAIFGGLQPVIFEKFGMETPTLMPHSCVADCQEHFSGGIEAAVIAANTELASYVDELLARINPAVDASFEDSTQERIVDIDSKDVADIAMHLRTHESALSHYSHREIAGKLSGRRLAALCSGTSRSVFRQRTVGREVGGVFGVLVDGSGSMHQVFDTAVRAGVTITEALRRFPNIYFECASFGAQDGVPALRRLARRRSGGYALDFFDSDTPGYAAIIAMAKRLQKLFPYRRRYIIVVSDLAFTDSPKRLNYESAMAEHPARVFGIRFETGVRREVDFPYVTCSNPSDIGEAIKEFFINHVGGK